MAGLGAAFMALTLLIFAVYGVFAAWLRQHVLGRPGVMRWTGRALAASRWPRAGRAAGPVPGPVPVRDVSIASDPVSGRIRASSRRKPAPDPRRGLPTNLRS